MLRMSILSLSIVALTGCGLADATAMAVGGVARAVVVTGEAVAEAVTLPQRDGKDAEPDAIPASQQ